MSKEIVFKKVILMFFLSLCLVSMTGCGNKKNKEDLLSEKIEQEVDYLDKRIVSMTNILNNVSFTNYKVVSENIKGQNKQSDSSKNEEDDSSSSDDSKSSQNSSSSQSDTSAEKGKGEEKSGDNEQNENKNMLYKMTENNILETNSNSEVQWKEVKKEVENIYTLWTTISIDMKQAKIDDSDIALFSQGLDELAKSVKDENKQETLKRLSDIYDSLPKFLEKNSNSTYKTSIYKTKAYIIKACSIASSDLDWEKAKDELTKANDEFKKVSDDKSLDRNKQQNVEKATILLIDLNNSIETQDKEIFLLRYKNAMQEINML